MDTPRPTRMQVTLDDLTMFDEWLAQQHEEHLLALDRQGDMGGGVSTHTVQALQHVRRMQRKVAEARERCNSPAPERGEVDEPDAEAS
jgi:hypothetical protein